MKEETAAWLEPMLDAVGSDPVLKNLMTQASFPMVEAADSNVDALGTMLADTAIPESALRAIDWIRFGQLLRDHLGWEGYPASPAES